VHKSSISVSETEAKWAGRGGASYCIYVAKNGRKKGRGKGVLVHAIKVYVGAEVYLHSFEISAVGRRELTTSRSGHFRPGQTALAPTVGRVGPTASLEGSE
jgi:hypothetical protein